MRNISIAVSESCESTAAVNVLMNVFHFKTSPLKEVKSNFGNFIPSALTGAAQLVLFTFDKLWLIFINCSSFDIFYMVCLMLYSISSHWIVSFSNSSSPSSIITFLFIYFKSLCFPLKFCNIIINSSSFSSKIFFQFEVILVTLALAVPQIFTNIINEYSKI